VDTLFGDTDQTVVIPARELTGTRDEKRRQLEAFLAQLEIVRLALGDDLPGRVGAARPQPPVGALDRGGWALLTNALARLTGRRGGAQ
jgi:hypothetical protein